MASTATVIGQDTRIRAKVTGSHDVEVHGHLEGELTVDGEVRVESTGTVSADIRGRRIVVRGAVKGSLSADEAILLEEGARVVGDVHAPRVSIAVGALVRGYVETGNAGDAPKKSSAARPAARPAPAIHHAPAKPATKAAAKPAAKVVAKPAAKAPGKRMSLAGGKPPPPIVPALKKGTKAALTKKRG